LTCKKCDLIKKHGDIELWRLDHDIWNLSGKDHDSTGTFLGFDKQQQLSIREAKLGIYVIICHHKNS
jgi:hypothetical protein